MCSEDSVSIFCRDGVFFTFLTIFLHFATILKGLFKILSRTLMRIFCQNSIIFLIF